MKFILVEDLYSIRDEFSQIRDEWSYMLYNDEDAISYSSNKIKSAKDAIGAFETIEGNIGTTMSDAQILSKYNLYMKAQTNNFKDDATFNLPTKFMLEHFVKVLTKHYQRINYVDELQGEDIAYELSVSDSIKKETTPDDSDNKSDHTDIISDLNKVTADEQKSLNLYKSLQSLENIRIKKNLKDFIGNLKEVFKDCVDKRSDMRGSSDYTKDVKILNQTINRLDSRVNDKDFSFSTSVTDAVNNLLDLFYDFTDDYNIEIPHFVNESLYISNDRMRILENMTDRYSVLILINNERKVRLTINAEDYDNAERYAEQYIRGKALQDTEWEDAEIIEVHKLEEQ